MTPTYLYMSPNPPRHHATSCHVSMIRWHGYHLREEDISTFNLRFQVGLVLYVKFGKSLSFEWSSPSWGTKLGVGAGGCSHLTHLGVKQAVTFTDPPSFREDTKLRQVC